uniref:hypothetical protein n=1 Tax=Psammodictyon constrictum TaxID=515483 RepID=UPI001EF9D81F|nr:hypothetical protein MKU01_pgp031 [Psammodictyon constrictum]ULD16462.1 hypothetical protein [Psammodictyon constrictum]
MLKENSKIIYISELNLNKLRKWKKEEYSKICCDLKLILEGQKINQKDLHLGFIGLATQNSELIESNKKLNDQLETVVKELNELNKEREEKVCRKEARANRKRLPKRDPVPPEIYQALIKATEAARIRSNGYTAARLRIALCLLTITGIRVNELLPLKVHQLKTLLEEGWIKIDRSKRGPASHKAYLSKQGKQILKSRQKDFNLLYLFKEDKSYIFTSQLDHNKPIRREQITKDINRIMTLVSKNLPDQPNLKSHSFRTSFITQLWKDTNDIEFVRQVIGHSKLDTTSSYVQYLSEKERKERMSEI